MNDLKQKANTAVKLKLRLMLLLGMKDKVKMYIRYNGLGRDFLN